MCRFLECLIVIKILKEIYYVLYFWTTSDITLTTQRMACQVNLHSTYKIEHKHAFRDVLNIVNVTTITSHRTMFISGIFHHE